MDVSSCVDPVDEVGNSFACPFPIQDQPDVDDLAETKQQTKLFSLPSSLNLVSALKGGREKNGVLPRKLTVSWASDVYDPIPTISSHTVNRGSKKNQKPKSNKKNWKNEKKSHKGSSSRASAGKDKKRSRRVSGTSRPMYDLEPLTKLSDEFDSLTMYGSDSPPWFGTSLLKKSFTDMCYPVAEAL